MSPLKPLRSSRDHAQAMREIERLLALSPAKGSEELDRLEALAILVDAFESDHEEHRIDEPADPIEAIHFHLERLGKTPKDQEAVLGCSRTAGSLPRVVVAALQVEPNELAVLEGAGGSLIGYHRTTRGWAVRAGSTGGTHFLPVAQSTPSTSVRCFTSTMLTSCAATTESEWTRVAVIRVHPDV